MTGKEKRLKFWVFFLLLAVLAGCALNRAPVKKTFANLFSGSDTAVQIKEKSAESEPGSTSPIWADAFDQRNEKNAEPSTETERGALNTESAAQNSQTPASAAQMPAVETGKPERAGQNAAVRTKNEAKATALVPGIPQRDQLLTDNEIKYYTCSIQQRGVLRVSISSLKKSDMSSRLVSVYQVYYLNGSDGEKGTRLLHTMTAYTSEAVNDSPNIGVCAGEYIITVSAGYYVDLSAYELTLSFTPGTEYEIEYNNSAARYTEIYSGIRVRGSASLLENGTDRDWYMIRMHATGALQLSFAHKANELTTAAFKVTLYNNDMVALYSDVSAHDLALLESGTLGVDAGCYFICVESRVWFNGDYGLTVTKIVADLYEKEGNDTRATATPLENGRGITGALTARDDATDLDYYTFSVPGNGRVSVILSTNAPSSGSGESEKYFRRMTLTDAKGNVLYRGLQPQTQRTLQSGSLGLKKGTYFLLIDHDGLDSDNGEYLLRYTFTLAEGWETEPNDSGKNASELPLDALFSGALSDRGTDFDEDWYTFTLPYDCSVHLTLTHGANDTQAAVYVLELQNSQGLLLTDNAGRARIESRGGEGRADAEYTLFAGDYYIRIQTGTFADHGVYNLLLTQAEA